jgi:DNA-directed RNA polymerase specialized sigma24 family protein
MLSCQEEIRMKAEMICRNTPESLLKNEDFWKSLYETLRRPVTSLVHRYKVPSWIGQEDDQINDIIQETVTRLYNRLLTSPGEMFSIRSVEAFAYTIARHYCLDLVRKERRIAHLPEEAYELEMLHTLLDEEDELTRLLDALSLQSLFTEAARIIVAIPRKQRRALLVDLARYNDFSEQPTLLEQALAEVGIQLRDYCHLLPLDQLERTRHNALVSLSYRRLRACYPNVA